MPRVDELPMPAQNQIRAQRGEPAVEQKRMTLLQRLAHVGMGRREEEPEPAPVRRDQPSMRAPDPRTAAKPAGARPGDPVSEFAKRPPTRPVAEVPTRHVQQAGHEDDQLEIPAFLRRQAN
ncbi:MAG: cell division protein FtsZ, partial [Azorhizobium sp. 12-66-6]